VLLFLQAFAENTGRCWLHSKFKPDFTNALYYTEVNVIGKHLSGLLLIKLMPTAAHAWCFPTKLALNSSILSLQKMGSFKVFYIIDQMNKKAVITTLRKDFEIIMMQPANMQHGYMSRNIDSGYNYYAFPTGKRF
jgi:hypothetical protein